MPVTLACEAINEPSGDCFMLPKEEKKCQLNGNSGNNFNRTGGVKLRVWLAAIKVQRVSLLETCVKRRK